MSEQALQESHTLVSEIQSHVQGMPEGTLTSPVVDALLVLLRFHFYRYSLLTDYGSDSTLADRSRIMFCLTMLLRNGRREELLPWEEIQVQLCSWLQGDLADGDDETFQSPLFAATIECLEEWGDFGGLVDRDKVIHLVAWGRWHRFRVSREDRRLLDLIASVDHFEEVYEPGRTFVPPEVREYLDRLREPAGAWVQQHLDPSREQPSGLRSVGRSVLLARAALDESATDADRVEAAAELVTTLVLRYSLTQHDADIEEAANLSRWLMDLANCAAAADAYGAAALAAGQALSVYANTFESATDASAAADLARSLLASHDLQGSELLLALAILASAAMTMAASSRDPGPLDIALRAVQSSLVHEELDRPKTVLGLAELHHARFRLSRSIQDFENGKDLLLQLLREERLDDGMYEAVRTQLAWSWHDRWKFEGVPDFLNEAVSVLRRGLIRSGDKARPENWERLAYWLYERYELFSHPSDLSEASNVLVRLCQDHGPRSPLLVTNALLLAVSTGLLEQEDERLNVVSVLAELAKEENPTDEPSSARRHANLAVAFDYLHQVSGREEHLTAAIKAAGYALRMAGTTDVPAAFTALLAMARAALVRNSKEMRDLDLARTSARRAREIARSSAEKAEASRLHVLALTLTGEKSGHNAERYAALVAARALASDEAAPGSIRRQAARIWAQEAVALHDYESAYDGYWVLVRMLKDKVWRASGPASRRESIAAYNSAAREGATCGVLARSPEKALRILEFGRDIERRHIAGRRASLEQLSRDLPEASERIDELKRAFRGLDKLESAERFMDYLEGVIAVMLATKNEWIPDLEARSGEFLRPDGSERAERFSKQQIANIVDRTQDLRLIFDMELQTLLAQSADAQLVQDILVDDSWLKRLSAATSGGAAVIINVSRLGCHAILCIESDVKVVELNEMTEDGVLDHISRLYDPIIRLQHGEPDGAQQGEVENVVRRTQDWLWRVAAEPTLQALGFDEPRDVTLAPCVWWCLTGPLSFLPIHAAESRDGQRGCSAMERVVSSYVTSLSSLIDNHEKPRPSDDLAATVLAMPDSEGGAGLPGVDREVKTIIEIFSSRDITLTNDDSTVDDAVQGIQRASWVHAACHGVPGIPGESPAGLYTRGGFLSTTRLGWVEKEYAELAYLSSCHSAVAISKAVDELEHVAAIFQGIGFTHVIATLWGASDRVAATVAIAFYRQLLQKSRPDAAMSARTLHAVLMSVREQLPPVLWVPFVHFGP